MLAKGGNKQPTFQIQQANPHFPALMCSSVVDPARCLRFPTSRGHTIRNYLSPFVLRFTNSFSSVLTSCFYPHCVVACNDLHAAKATTRSRRLPPRISAVSGFEPRHHDAVFRLQPALGFAFHDIVKSSRQIG
uniref:Uncharacterized protein n=1 Tax=Physcomitrium patens TaxID=3218 RepID=A0A2K1L7T2_PHYPA|nr:hypothetical protein PHYPA_000478 [Physcomitrium patens]